LTKELCQENNIRRLKGNNNTSYNQTGGYTQYLIRIGIPWNVPGGRSVNNWYNLVAFAVQAPGTYGNERRNSLRGPGLTNVNFSLGKNFIIWRQVNFQLRGDATNLLKHPSFSQPNNNIGSSQAGQITGTTVGGRNMQISGRLTF
jgi:hypothetical protein